MGERSTYACPQCGFTALVSGGRDVGMKCNTITIECLTCQILIDQLESYWSDGYGFQAQRIECPVHPEHPWREWTHPGKCPKCGTEMELKDDGCGMLWD